MSLLAIFDLDGTLVDTPRAIVEAFAATFESLGWPAPETAAIRATIGRPLERAFSDLLAVPLDDAHVGLGVQTYQVFFRELILPRAESLLFPGVAEGLATLRDEGIALAVATSKFYASADALLKAVKLRHHFRVVVGADQVAQPKPHPATGRLILETLGVAAAQAVMVGDTTHDLLMANAAGMRSIGVTYGVHGLEELQTSEPTWIADSFDEVLECLMPARSNVEWSRC
jgi:phosphoglycolate phosphatase